MAIHPLSHSYSIATTASYTTKPAPPNTATQYQELFVFENIQVISSESLKVWAKRNMATEKTMKDCIIKACQHRQRSHGSALYTEKQQIDSVHNISTTILSKILSSKFVIIVYKIEKIQ